METQKIHPLTPIYTRIRKHIELNVSQQKFNDDVYQTYKFPFSCAGLKNTLYLFFLK
jgi:hypothetical protein